jgi:hypothetical protein
LPTAGKNQTIFLAVGVSILKLRLQNYIKSGESLDLNVSVYGNGNLRVFSLPKPIVPAALNCMIQNTPKMCKRTFGMEFYQRQILHVPQYKGNYQ